MVLPAAVLIWVAAVQPPAPETAPLTDAERAVIESGQQVVREERVPDSPWPRVTVVQLVDASPAEAAAVFTDYDRHSTFLPGVKKSVVSGRVSAQVAEVDYVLYVPVFADEHYTVRDSLSRSGATGYRVDWSKVRARSTKSIAGNVQFDPYRNARTGRDVTVVTYVNLVVPGQKLAGPLKGRAMKQVRETVIALVNEIELMRENHPQALASRVAALAAALDPDATLALPPPAAASVGSVRTALRPATSRRPDHHGPRRAVEVGR